MLYLYKSLLTFFFVLILLSGCSSLHTDNIIQNRDKEYLKARTTPPIKIPPGMSSSSIQALYPIPDRYYPENLKHVDLTPPDLN